MKKLKVIIIGYGKMGKEIEAVALQQGHEIIHKIDGRDDWKQLDLIQQADVAIDFSIPDIAMENMRRAMSLMLPLVIGTTGWYDHMDTIEEETKLSNATVLWASNFSLGVNILFHFNQQLAKVMHRFPEYRPHIHEIHHTQKLDAPSGTAISIANGIIGEYENLDDWKLQENKEIHPPHLVISHERLGQVTGTHEISYSSDIDQISLRHEAKNRKGFAQGAVLAAEWLVGKKGFFNMKDVLGF